VIEDPVSILRRLPRSVRVLVFGHFVNRLGTFIVPYLALVMRREFHLSEPRVGLLMASYGAGTLVSILLGGHLSDRLGRRSAMILSLFGSGALAIAMTFTSSLAVFVPLLLAMGFLADLYRPASAALISDSLSSRERAMGFAALRMAVNLGYAFGVALGGFLADWNFRLLFALDGATTVLFGVIVYALIPETRPLGEGEGGTRGQGSLADPVLFQITVAGFAACFVLSCFLTTLPLAVSITAGYPARVYGGLVAMNGLTVGFCEVSVVSFLARFRRLKVAAFGIMLLGVGFGLTGLVLHWAWFLFTVFLWTGGEILAMPQQMSFVADWAPPEYRGRYLGFYQAAWSVGIILNPLILFPLHARLPEVAFWPLLLLIAIPASLLLLHIDRHFDRPDLLRGREETALGA
jgi:MFS family permease